MNRRELACKMNKDFYDDNFNYYLLNIENNATKIILCDSGRGDSNYKDSVTDWGDGFKDQELSHIYNISGIYLLKTKYTIINENGKYECLSNYLKYVIGLKQVNKHIDTLDYMCNGLNIYDINITRESINELSNKSMISMIGNCNNLLDVDLSYLNTSKIKSFNNMINNCSSLKYINLSNFIINKDCDVKNMINNCNNLTELVMNNLSIEDDTDLDLLINNNKSLKILYMNNCNIGYRCRGLETMMPESTAKLEKIYMLNSNTNATEALAKSLIDRISIDSTKICNIYITTGTIYNEFYSMMQNKGYNIVLV